MSYDGYDSDGDVSRYLQSPRPELYLLDVPEPDVQAPGMVGENLSPAVMSSLDDHHPGLDVGFPVTDQILGVEQQPENVDNGQHQDVLDESTLQQGSSGVGNNSWVDEMLAEAPRVIFSPPRPRRQEEPQFVFVPFAPGELDCALCHPSHELTKEIDHHKIRLVVHCGDLAAFQHAIFHSMSKDDNGQFRTVRMFYVDLRNHTDRAVKEFIDNSMDSAGQIFSGRLQEEQQGSSNVSTALPDDGSRAEPEISNRLQSLFVNMENASGF